MQTGLSGDDDYDITDAGAGDRKNSARPKDHMSHTFCEPQRGPNAVRAKNS